MYTDEHLSRKFLVIIDGSLESRAALRWAERRAHSNAGTLLLLIVLEKGGFEHWIGVKHLIQSDARQKATEILADLSNEVEKIAGRKPECAIREGDTLSEILSLIDEDRSISSLVLATGCSKEGGNAGALIVALASGQGMYRIPVTVVPGDLSDDAIDSLT